MLLRDLKRLVKVTHRIQNFLQLQEIMQRSVIEDREGNYRRGLRPERRKSPKYYDISSTTQGITHKG